MQPSCAGSFDEALLSGYLDGSLTSEQTRAVRRHLEECAACRALYDEMVALRDVTSSTDFDVPMPEEWPELPQPEEPALGRRPGRTLLLTWLAVITVFAAWRWLSGSGDPLELYLLLGLPGAAVLLVASLILDRLRDPEADGHHGGVSR